ncbi:MAG: nucleotidyl transferase AbiEii/AbiGii toxin family protein [Bacteroidales bacterium]|nr:nucleotidyl transferase AbiEii/AbiGii toxin family protein [Bacteroidales bacterium]
MPVDLSYIPTNARMVFNKLAKQTFMQSYVLVGGTALAMQIKHRLSEDLDFIADSETLKTTVIRRIVTKLFPECKIIREDTQWQIDIIVENTKLTWFSSGAVAAGFKTKDYAFQYQNLWIARPEIIAVHKLSALSQRNTLRDYYDLYCIARYHIPLKSIFELTQRLQPNISPITYSETLIYTNDIPEENMNSYLEPSEKINKQQLSEFFIAELRKIKDQL